LPISRRWQDFPYNASGNIEQCALSGADFANVGSGFKTVAMKNFEYLVHAFGRAGNEQTAAGLWVAE
jgi:hypothetical protein